MKVTYLFSKNNKIGSKLISWASSYESLKNVKAPNIPSHVALEANGIVLEATMLKNVRYIPYTEWLKINQQVHKVEKEVNLDDLIKAMDETSAKRYDWMAIIYFIYCFIKLILFKKPLPKTNPIHHKSKYFCTEVIGKLEGKDLSMTTPAALCDAMLQLEDQQK